MFVLFYELFAMRISLQIEKNGEDNKTILL